MAGFFDWITSPFTGSGSQAAADAQKQSIAQAQLLGGQDIGQARNDLTNYFTQALTPWQNLSTSAAAPVTMASNALTGTDPAATNAAYQSFQKYVQPQIDLGSQNVLRQGAAAGGGPLSGGQLAALQNYGQSVAAPQWQNWMQNALQFLNPLTAAASGQSNVLTGLGSNLSNLGQFKTGMDVGLTTSAGNAQANADLARQQGAGNALGATLGLANLGTGFGSTLGGNFLSGLGSRLFGAFGS